MPIRRRRRPPPQRGPAPLPWERGGTTSRGRGPGPRRPRLCPPARRHPRRGQRGSRRPAGTAGGAAVRPVSPPRGLRAPVRPLCLIPVLRLYPSAAAAPMFDTLLCSARNATSCPVTEDTSPPLRRAESGLFPLAGELEGKKLVNP